MANLEEKINHSLEIIQLASDASHKYYKKPIVVAYSGGKDSDVLLHLIKKSGVPYEILHNHTTVDAPETVYHVREVFKQERENDIVCTLHKPVYKGEPTNMWKLIVTKKVPPTRLMRYCCHVLKEVGGKKRIVAIGVRKSESSKRSHYEEFKYISSHKEYNISKPYWELKESFDNADVLDEVWECRMITRMKKNQKISCCPILDWTEEDIWEYIKQENIKVNPLYSQGWKRVGCIGCPMAGKHRVEEFEKYPNFKRLWIMAFDRMVEAQKKVGLNRNWENGQDVFDWWMQ